MRHLRETVFLPLVLGWDKTGNIYILECGRIIRSPQRHEVAHRRSYDSRYHITDCSIIQTKAQHNKLKWSRVRGCERDSTPFNMWATYFFKAQRYGASNYNLVKWNILYQENESCIKLANNGKSFSSKRTRHINIIYSFVVTDWVKNKELEIQHCPTKEMLGDFFTKPLQGALFTKFRNS